MEDILSSIKRIIAEEGDVGAVRNRRPLRPAGGRPLPRDVLELSDPVEYDAEDEAEEPAKMTAPEPTPIQSVNAMAKPDSPGEPLLSRGAESATLDALSRLIVKPEVSGSDTLEGMVREMLRPMLREWLDSHLPAMVEQMVAKEISRITSQGR
ncbi:hypothetical protein AWL63_21235 [Sphingomonas panacis]|uniref:Pole-organizing protein PopZ n=2 Tax=Sphingomonas panacis TaxID=1560345 RepID=A0A1B3ZHT7_9SPHN|nr:hypothetical protein AWL63_21235 [Sphingomonas panacis]